VSNQTQSALEKNWPTLDLSAPAFAQHAQIKSNNIANTKTIDKTNPAPNGPNVHNLDVITSNQEIETPVE
jgi:hypothetical protein